MQYLAHLIAINIVFAYHSCLPRIYTPKKNVNFLGSWQFHAQELSPKLTLIRKEKVNTMEFFTLSTFGRSSFHGPQTDSVFWCLVFRNVFSIYLKESNH